MALISPLVPAVIYATSQIKINTSSVGQYNGDTNSTTRIEKLSDHMTSMGATDMTYYRLFPLILDD